MLVKWKMRACVLCYLTFQIYSIIGTRLLETFDMSRVEADVATGRIREQVSKLRDLEVIPTKAMKWVSISSQPMIADDKMLERQFQRNQEISFVDVGDKLKRSSGPRRQQNRSVQGKVTSMITRLLVEVFSCPINDFIYYDKFQHKKQNTILGLWKNFSDFVV